MPERCPSGFGQAHMQARGSCARGLYFDVVGNMPERTPLDTLKRTSMSMVLVESLNQYGLKPRPPKPCQLDPSRARLGKRNWGKGPGEKDLGKRTLWTAFFRRVANPCHKESCRPACAKRASMSKKSLLKNLSEESLSQYSLKPSPCLKEPLASMRQ